MLAAHDASGRRGGRDREIGDSERTGAKGKRRRMLWNDVI